MLIRGYLLLNYQCESVSKKNSEFSTFSVGKKRVHPVNAYVDQTDQGLGAVWREKSFGQRLKFGAGGGKFVPLGPRTIFLDRTKRPIHLTIIRKSP